jgi:hypothetical protein
MNITDIAAKPKLLKLTITEDTIVEKYGDSLDFYIWDRQPLNLFNRLANAGVVKDFDYAELLSDIVLDEKGEKVMKDGNVLPMDVMTAVMKEVGSVLGK